MTRRGLLASFAGIFAAKALPIEAKILDEPKTPYLIVLECDQCLGSRVREELKKELRPIADKAGFTAPIVVLDYGLRLKLIHEGALTANEVRAIEQESSKS